MGNKKYYRKNNNYNKNNNYYKKNKKNYYYMNKNNVNKNNIDYNVNNNHGDVNINKEDNDYTIDNEIIENDFEVVLKKKEKKEFSLDDIQKDLYTLSKTENLGVDINKEDLKDEEDVEIKKKPRKNLLIKTNFGYALGIIILLLALVGTTYSYFNYTKDTRQADIASGDIYVKVMEDTVNLTGKLYPSTKEEARSKSDNVVTFTVKGINTSEKTLYYEVKLNYGDSKNSPYLRFNDSDLVFDLIEVNGSTETYVVNAKSFNDISTGSRIWADNIPANTTTEVTKTYKLRMWLSDKVTIDDDNGTYPASTYKNYYASIKASVFGDFTEKEPPLDARGKLAKLAQPDTGINFGNNSSDSNGKGLYKLGNTDILYYRGEVDDNNVIFGGFCWQIVRTTDTGGIKMIYNGVAKKTVLSMTTETMTDTSITYTNDATYPYSYDTTTKKWTSTNHTDNKTGTMTFTVNIAGEYAISYTVSSEATYDKVKFYKGSTLLREDSGSKTETIELGEITTSDVIKIEYTKDSGGSSGSDNVIFEIVKVTDKQESENLQCNNTKADDRQLASATKFNSNYTSMSDVGYMYNKRYAYNSTTPTEGAYFGSGVNYDDTTNTYTLTGADVTAPDASHHYSCDLTDPAGSCGTVRYYYYVSGTTYYHIKLTGGEKIEDAIYKMTGNGTSEVKARAINQNYELNNTNSTIKTAIETWYQNNLASYTNYLEDTVYCNDRSFQENGSNTLLKSGWHPNVDNTSGNGGLTTYIYFNAKTRALNSWYNTEYVPVFTCPKEEDSFTVSSEKGNGKLTYPIGLLTSDEIILAGAAGNASTKNNKYYLYTGSYYWGFSPSSFSNSFTSEFSVNSTGSLNYNLVANAYGVRPVVSLKSGTEFESGGDGTTTNPYVVKISS